MVGAQSASSSSTKSGGGGKKSAKASKAVDTKQSSILRWFGTGSNAPPRPPQPCAVANEGKAAETAPPLPPREVKRVATPVEPERTEPLAAAMPSTEGQGQACASPETKPEVEAGSARGKGREGDHSPKTSNSNYKSSTHHRDKTAETQGAEEEEKEEREQAHGIDTVEAAGARDPMRGEEQGCSEGEGQEAALCVGLGPSEGVGACVEEGLSAFERERLANIRANQAFLASLGLASLQPSTLLGSEAGSKKRSKKRKERPHSPPPHTYKGPVRRSGRNRTTRTSTMAEDGAVEDSVTMIEEEEEEEVDYDDSSVLKYMCHHAPNTNNTNNTGSGGGGCVSLSSSSGVEGPTTTTSEGVRGFSVLGYGVLQDPCLSAIYSMHLLHHNSNSNSHNNPRPPLAAGGKQGRVCIFSAPREPQPPTDEEGEGEGGGRGRKASGVLLSFQGHRGWVCDVRWLPVGGSSSSSSSSCLLLVSGGNDGVVKLWDVNKTSHTKAHGHMPRLLQTMDRVHSKGLFSLHSWCEGQGEALVASGAKDGVAVVYSLTPSGSLSVSHTYHDVHDGVIKAVRLRDRHTLAVGGDDRTVQVVDLREKEGGGGGRLWVGQDLHAHTVHSIRFHPTHEHMMVTAGLDPVIKLWDLRKASSNQDSSGSGSGVCPLSVLSGHVSSLAPPRLKDMHHPEFYHNGRYLLSCGERAQRLSIYDVSTGLAVSRGQLAAEGSLLCPRSDCGDLLVADRQGNITTLRPFLEQ